MTIIGIKRTYLWHFLNIIILEELQLNPMFTQKYVNAPTPHPNLTQNGIATFESEIGRFNIKFRNISRVHILSECERLVETTGKT